MFIVDKFNSKRAMHLLAIARFLPVLTIACASVASTTAAAEPELPTYWSGQYIYLATDGDRRADFGADGGHGMRVSWGVEAAPAVVFELSGYGIGIDVNGDGRKAQYGVDADGRWVLGSGAIRPHLLAGFGLARTRLPQSIGGQYITTRQVRAGFGLTANLFERSDLRFDAVWRTDFDPKSVSGIREYQDWVIGIGLIRYTK